MGQNKKILVCIVVGLLIITCLSLSGCNSAKVAIDNNSTRMEDKSIDFPLRENGYPKNDIVMINEKTYPLERYNPTNKSSVEYTDLNLELSESDKEIKVILPRNIEFCAWNIEDKEGIDLLSYNKITIPVKNEELLDGEISDLESFTFSVAPHINEVSFKLINETEKGKSFNDKQESYLLKINISRK